MRWARGQLIVRREVLRGRPWLGLPAHVVEHSRELLAINLQAPFEVRGHCLDTLDHELDVVVEPGSHVGRIKDAEKVDESARRGRFDTAQAERIHRQGEDLLALVRAGDPWWEPWRSWEPDPTWTAPDTIPDGWDT